MKEKVDAETMCFGAKQFFYSLMKEKVDVETLPDGRQECVSAPNSSFK